MRKEKGNSQTSQDNNTSAIRQSQGPYLVLPQGLQILFSALYVNFLADTETPTRWRKQLCMLPHKQVNPRPLGSRRLMTLPLHYLTTDHANTVRHLTTTTRPDTRVLRYCLLWPSFASLNRQKLICFYFTQLFLKGAHPRTTAEAGFWQQIGRFSVWGWTQGSPTGVPWLDPTLQGHSSKPGSLRRQRVGRFHRGQVALGPLSRRLSSSYIRGTASRAVGALSQKWEGLRRTTLEAGEATFALKEVSFSQPMPA